MADRFMDINASAGVGRNPITKAGRVAYNGYVDADAIKNRKANVKNRTSFYEGDMADASFAILQRDILLTEKSRVNRQRDRVKASNPFVLASLNGAGTRSQTKRSMVANFSFAGVAGSQGAQYDSTSTTSDSNLAMDIGGLSTIVNTGPERIKNGDLIWWDLPDPRETERARKGSERLVPITKPYDPSKVELNERNIPAILAAGFDEQTLAMGKYPPLVEGAHLMKRGLSMDMLLGIHVALSSGLVKLAVDPENMSDSGQRQAQINGSDYVRSSNLRQRVLTALAEELGLIHDISKKRANIRIDRKDTNTEKYATGVMSASSDDDLVLPLAEGTRMLPGGTASLLIKMQKRLISDMVAATQRIADFTRERVFAKAISPADSGGEMDVILSHYMA